MAYENLGEMNLGVIGNTARAPYRSTFMDAQGVASGQAFLIAELSKRDPLVRTPLSSVTYPRDINVRVGGGWVDYVSAMQVGYGLTGGADGSPVVASGADDIPIIQANFDHGVYKAHSVAMAMRVMWQDMQRANFIGRSLDQMLMDGIRLAYDKHMEQNVYVGISKFGTTGLVNSPNVTATNVSAGAGGTTTWASKTPAEILADVNTAITATWAASGYDRDAIPNHMIVPYEQYTYILNTPVTSLASETILDYILKNNVATRENGDAFFIGGTAYCDGAGTLGADRMVVYCNKERYLAVDELAPITRAMTQPNAEHACYDTAYMANVSEVEIFYPQTIRYYDGI